MKNKRSVSFDVQDPEIRSRLGYYPPSANVDISEHWDAVYTGAGNWGKGIDAEIFLGDKNFAASVVCSPDDTYDFCIGAHKALQRIFDQKKFRKATTKRFRRHIRRAVTEFLAKYMEETKNLRMEVPDEEIDAVARDLALGLRVALGKLADR